MALTHPILVDAHQDIAYTALNFGRDYRRAAYATRRLEARRFASLPNGLATLGLPDALLGRVAVVFATLFVAPRTKKDSADDPFDRMRYETPAQAERLALEQYDYYRRLEDESGRVRLIRTEADLDAVLATWADGTDLFDHRQGLVLLMENADPIREPAQFEEWYERGVRIVGPAWSISRYSHGTGYPGGLTKLGRELLEVMASFNAILDLSHMAEAAYLEAVDRYEGQVLIASHSNPRRFCDTDRHLSDLMIRRLAERDGVMGIVFYNRFLSNEWRSGDPKQAISRWTPIDAIDAVCQITGSAAHVGIGTDFDGGFGAESIPEGFDTVSDLLWLAQGLRERGYGQADIEAILSGNMLRKLRQALPKG
jgi:membrane dipeptidase